MDQSSPLARIHRVGRGAIVAAGAGFDFDDDELVTLLGDQVDLSQTASPAAFQDLVAAFSELFGG